MKPHLRKYWDSFQAHTVFKHLVLESYASAWMQKVVRGRPGVQRLLVVDAFAGRGRDRRGNPGSPLRLARAAAVASTGLREAKGHPVPVHVVAIEQEHQWFTELANYLEPFRDDVAVLEGTLRDYLPGLLEKYGSGPTLYFLDPFGLKGLDADLVRMALAGDASEVLVLFNDPGAGRLAGAAGRISSPEVGSDAPRDLWGEPTPTSAGDRGSTDLIADDGEDEAEWARESPSRDVLNTAFGGDRWERAVAGIPPGRDWREAIIREYELLLQELGGHFTTRIPVLKDNGQREYTLIHASRCN